MMSNNNDNNNNLIKLFRLVVGVYPNSQPLFEKEELNNVFTFLSRLKNKKVKTIIYLLLEKKFTYLSDLNKVMDDRWKGEVQWLLSLGVIEHTELNANILYYLKKVNLWGESHYKKFQAYALTPKYEKLLSQEEFKEYIESDIDLWTKSKLERDKREYLEAARELLEVGDEKRLYEVAKLRQKQHRSDYIDDSRIKQYEKKNG